VFGEKKDGFIAKIPVGGFSGIVATIWGDVSPMKTFAKYTDGEQLPVILHNLRSTVRWATIPVDQYSDKRFYTGLMTQERFEFGI
jgi:hypothetical protein